MLLQNKDDVAAFDDVIKVATGGTIVVLDLPKARTLTRSLSPSPSPSRSFSPSTSASDLPCEPGAAPPLPLIISPATRAWCLFEWCVSVGGG